jgi:hypothetical protein
MTKIDVNIAFPTGDMPFECNTAVVGFASSNPLTYTRIVGAFTPQISHGGVADGGFPEILRIFVIGDGFGGGDGIGG